MPRLGKVLTTAWSKCPWWDHTITLVHWPALLWSSHISLHLVSMRYNPTSSCRVITGTPPPSFLYHTTFRLPTPYMTHPEDHISSKCVTSVLIHPLFFPPRLTPLLPTLCLYSCVVRRNEPVTHNQPRPTPFYIYIHSDYATYAPLMPSLQLPCKDTCTQVYAMHPCIEHTLFSEGAREHAVKNTNVKHARMRVAGYKIWAGGGGEPRPTGSYPTPTTPSLPVPTHD